MKLRKRLFTLTVALVVSIFTISQVSYASKFVDDLRPKRGPETDARQYAEGFLSEAGKEFAHDKVFKLKTDKAFHEGRAINIFGHLQEDLHAVAERYLLLNPQIETALSVEAIEETLRDAQNFIKAALEDENFITETVKKILSSTPTEKGQALYDAVKKAWEWSDINNVKISSCKEVLLNNSRFVCLLFGNQGNDPYLYNIGSIASEEHRAIVAHAGRYSYVGSEGIEGGPRTIYLTLARLHDYRNLGDLGKNALRELIAHELTDLVSGHKDEDLPNLIKANAEIDKMYATQVVKVTQGDRRGAITMDTDKVSLEKYTYTNDLGMKEVFAIKCSSKVHPDVPKGSRKITVTVVKADVGSIGGHGSAPGTMLEAVADIWAQAAAEGKILDFFITRVGDDISVTVTHIKGKDNEEIHHTAWDGFINASVVSTDASFYGAGQDLLVDSFAGNLKGAGPSFAEVEFIERPSETIITGQADKTAPGAFNRGLYGIFLDPNMPYVHLSKQSKDMKFGVIDFDYNGSVGREGFFSVPQYQDIFWYLGFPDRYSITRIVDGKGEDVAAVTAQRLGKIAGKYVGKDDPMFVCRSQKQYPAVGEITAPFLKDDYTVPGWMRGSNKGPFLPVAIPDAKIGIYDGPPLLSIWSFNLNNGRLGGFMDLMAANPAIREIQNRRTVKALELLNQGWHEMGLRLGQEEMEYQDGVKDIEARAKATWVENTPAEKTATVPRNMPLNVISREYPLEVKVILYLGEEVLKNIHDFGAVLASLSRGQIAVILVNTEVQRNIIASSPIKDFDNFKILTIREAGLEGFDLRNTMVTHGYRIEDLNNISLLPLTTAVKESSSLLEGLETESIKLAQKGPSALEGGRNIEQRVVDLNEIGVLISDGAQVSPELIKATILEFQEEAKLGSLGAFVEGVISDRGIQRDTIDFVTSVAGISTLSASDIQDVDATTTFMLNNESPITKSLSLGLFNLGLLQSYTLKEGTAQYVAFSTPSERKIKTVLFTDEYARENTEQFLKDVDGLRPDQIAVIISTRDAYETLRGIAGISERELAGRIKIMSVEKNSAADLAFQRLFAGEDMFDLNARVKKIDNLLDNKDLIEAIDGLV